jgi:hypothetical protein
LLHDVPIGSSSDAVRTYLRRKTGREPTYKKNFISPEGTPIIGVGTKLKDHYYAGQMCCSIGSYIQFLIVYTDVETRWEFDAKDHLIGLKVLKIADAL